MKRILLHALFLLTSYISSADCWTSFGTNRSAFLAIKSDSTLWSWGVNTFDQLGDTGIYIVNAPRSGPGAAMGEACWAPGPPMSSCCLFR
jgi:hypothetical protein